MNGWIAFILLASLVLVLLWRFGRLDNSALMLITAALLVAAAGYVRQGHPRQPGADVRRPGNAQPESSAFASELRRLSPLGTGNMLSAKRLETFNRLRGAARAAVLEHRIERFPDDTVSRVGYAYTLFEIADYRRTPAVSLAFGQAAAHAARCDPEVAYFEGFAALESGEMAAALSQWRELRTTLCPHSRWTGPLDQRIAILEGALTDVPIEGHGMQER